MLIIRTLISDWRINQPGHARVVKALKNCRFITLKVALCTSYVVCVHNQYTHVCVKRNVYSCTCNSCVFHMFMVQNYQHTKLYACSKIVCAVRGQHMRVLHVSCLSCGWCVPQTLCCH